MKNKMSPKKKKKNSANDFGMMRTAFAWILLFLMVMWVGNFFNSGGNAQRKLTYTEFYSFVEHNRETPVIASVDKMGNFVSGEFTKEKGGAKFRLYVPEDDKDLVVALRKNVDKFEVKSPQNLWMYLISVFGPMILFIAVLWYFSYRGNQIGSRIWSFGRVRTQPIEKEKATKITFLDVAGVDEAKEELKEVIEFLKDPGRFQKLGGRIPKGVLLVGPPGCGKTLLAKAVAGEADVPFFSLSGSDFVEMFVGVGASRVRDLFDQAKKGSKASGKGSIIFIDEIDAVGRQRFAGIGGGHDEREQTLNQLLVEMDGFTTGECVIVMAATNRPDVLDPALLRPGRFDRHVVIDAPDMKGREAILGVHTRKIKLDPGVNLSSIAKQTPGFSGADLANLCNEAALLAARRNKQAVYAEELHEAIERVMAGPERKSRIISKQEKEIIAYHETGHALVSLFAVHADPLHKVSIIPRGVHALGYTLHYPLQDRYLVSKTKLLDQICVSLGGFAAEELILNEVTTGSYSDLKHATDIARRMVIECGMSERIGHLTLAGKEGFVFLGRDMGEHKAYSEETAKIIDDEIKRIVEESYARAKKILQENIEKVKLVAQKLLEKEVLDAEEVKQIIGMNNEGNPSQN